MEDMKTCGLKNRRLKEMLKFFYRSWTELVEDADGNADWLLAGEEADVHGLLKGILDFTGGILEPELSALAVRYLLADGEALAGAQRAHVLVDDYQMLSRAPNMWRTCWPATPSPWPPIPRPWWRSSIPTPMVRAWASSPRPTPIASASC